MKKLTMLSVFVLLIGFGAAAQAATFTMVNNNVDFQNLVGVTYTENFQGPTLSLAGLSITEYNGNGIIHGGVYENVVKASDDRYQVYNYAPGMYAFGAWLDLLNPGGMGSSIDMSVVAPYTQFVQTVPSSDGGGFYGFTSDTIFTSVKFSDAQIGSGSQETYYNVDLSLKAAPVPIPGAAYLLGSGLLGLLGLRRKSAVV